MSVTDEAGAARRALAQATVVVFDFDGTLVDSNEIKWRGFEIAFADYPDRQSEIVTYCRQHHHTPRGQKFRFVCERIVGIEYTPALAAALHARFAAVTTDAIVAATEIDGASALLERLMTTAHIGVLSSTPDAVLRDILDRKAWRRYFTWVQGAPIDKSRWLARLARDLMLSPSAAVFFGDTLEDRAASASAGWPFIGVRNPELAGSGRWIAGFSELA